MAENNNNNKDIQKEQVTPKKKKFKKKLVVQLIIKSMFVLFEQGEDTEFKYLHAKQAKRIYENLR